MGDSIEAKAQALLMEVRKERGAHPMPDEPLNRTYIAHEALYRAIEQHEAFEQEVSDAVGAYLKWSDECLLARWDGFDRFIIPKLKPDPLVEVLLEIDHAIMWADICAEEIRASLGARGWEIREKGQ